MYAMVTMTVGTIPMKKNVQLIVNGKLGPCGPHAPKLVVLELKQEHDLKAKKHYTVEKNVQDPEETSNLATNNLVQVIKQDAFCTFFPCSLTV